MLLRRWHALLRESEAALSGEHRANATAFRERLERCMRFVFSRASTEAAQQIAARPESLDAAREQLFAPFPETWIEFEGEPHAVMWSGYPHDILRGGAYVVTERPPPLRFSLVPFWINLRLTPYIIIPPVAQKLAREARRKGLPAHDYADLHALGVPLEVGRMMLACWALLATKGMTGSVAPDMSRLNKARQQRGLYPLLGYTEIRLNLDVERAIRAKHATGTGRMPQHGVRAHLRLLPTGKVTIVKAHMRGNPEYGRRGHHYTVVRAEDVE